MVLRLFKHSRGAVKHVSLTPMTCRTTKTYSVKVDEDYLPVRALWSVQDLGVNLNQAQADSTLTQGDLENLATLARLEKPKDSAETDSLLKELSRLNQFLKTLKNLPLDNVEPLYKIETSQFFEVDLNENLDGDCVADNPSSSIIKHSKKTFANLFLIPLNN